LRLVATIRRIINHTRKTVKTSDAIEKAGGKRALAELLGITAQAIQGWGETVPKARQFMIKTLRPEWFGRLDKRGKK
jgi:hypothetical protein